MNDVALPDLKVDWTAMWHTAQAQGLGFLVKLLAAVAIFLIGRAIVRLIVRGLHRLMMARSVDPILESFLGNLLSWGLMAFVIIAAISQLGVQTTSLIAMLGAAGIAVGLALQGSLSNFAAGVLIVLFRPYRVGDWVEVAGVSGSIVQVQIFSTVLASGDNKHIIIPNGQVMANVIVNHSSNATRRIDLTFGVGYDDDLAKVEGTLRELIAAEPRILAEPGCQIGVGDLGASAVNVFVRPWVKTEDYWAVRTDLIAAVKRRFDEHGISLPYPHQVVYNVDAKAPAA